MATTGLRAYVLRDRTECSEGMEVVFARTGRDARKRGLDDVAYIDTAARRAPEFDRFVGTRGPGAADLLEAGWHFECGGCCQPVNAYDLAIHDDGRGLATGLATDTEAFCSPACQAGAAGRDRGYRFAREERAAFLAAVRTRWPEAAVCWYGWNRPAFGEPLPPDGFRLGARLHWRRADADVYADYDNGDRDHTTAEVCPREVRHAAR